MYVAIVRHAAILSSTQLFSVLFLHYIILNRLYSFEYYAILISIIIIDSIKLYVYSNMSFLFCIIMFHLLLGCLCYRVRCRLQQHKLFLIIIFALHILTRL